MKKLLLSLLLITFISFVAQAQYNGTAVISAAINSSVNASVSGTPTLGAFTTDAHIQDGLITAPVDFEVKSNRPWKLMTSITNIVGTPIAGGPATIDVNATLQPIHISWGTVNTAGGNVTSWTAFANTSTTTAAAVQAKTGSRGAPGVSGNTFALRYKVTPGFAVDPGTYAVDVTYTVSAQ